MSDERQLCALLEKDTTFALQVLPALTIEAETSINRLALNTSAACDSFASAVGATLESILVIIKDARLKGKRLHASRDKRLEWQIEEFDAETGLLESYERQLGVCVDDPIDASAIEQSLLSARQLLDGMDLLPSQSRAVSAGDSASAVCAITVMSHVQEGIDVVRSRVSCPQWFRCNEGASVTVACCDAFGDAVQILRPEDVHWSVSKAAIGWSAGASVVQGGAVSVRVSVGGPGAVPACTLSALIDRQTIDIPLQVCVHVCV